MTYSSTLGFNGKVVERARALGKWALGKRALGKCIECIIRLPFMGQRFLKMD